MDRFLIITNREKDNDLSVTNKIVKYMENAGKKTVLSGESSFTDNYPNGITKDIDCAIVLGGDGTIIQAANDLRGTNIPILGVNLGTVGFLAEIEEHHVVEALTKLFHNEYNVESRLMIHSDVIYHKSEPKTLSAVDYALNDVVITRKGFSRIISLEIYVNDILVDNFRGDGVIVSTPTGSTAYNLSAGGPIVVPQANVFVITPICPHSLSPRSVVVSADDTIKVVIGKSKKTQNAEAIATYDGNKVVDLGTNDIVLMKKAPFDTKLIRLNQTGIYEILRSKLGND